MMEYYCLDENHASRTRSSRFVRCQSPYQLQNLKILSTFQGHINPHGQNFLEFDFFLCEKTWLHSYYKNKNQLVVTSSSYINLTMKQLIKYCIYQPKNSAKVKFYFFCGGEGGGAGEAVSHFCFRQALHPFRLCSASRNDAG